MTTIDALVSRLRELDVKIWADGAEVRVSAPAGALTSDLVAELQARKDELRRFLAAARRSNVQPEIKRRPAGSRDMPLSFAQERFLLLQQLDPSSVAYSILTAGRLKGRLHLDCLDRAWKMLLCRHDVLNTAYQFVDGRPVQQRASRPSTVDLRDLQSLPAESRFAEALRLVEIEARTPFDLQTGPVARVRIWRLSPQDHVIAINMHHIVSDQWSVGIIGRELFALYEALSRDEDVSLPELSVDYVDYAEWQRARWSDGSWRDQLEYWRQQLAGVRILELPSNRPRPPVLTTNGALLTRAIPTAALEDIKSLGNRMALSPSMILMTAFFALLHRYTGQKDIVIAQPIAGRTQKAVENLVGAFVNTVAIRTDVTNGMRFSDLLERVKRTALDAYANQDFPFERLLAELNSPRDASHSPMVQVMFNVLNMPVAGTLSAGSTWEPLTIPTGAARFDLSLTIDPIGASAAVEYNTDIFEPRTVERFTAHYERLLESALTDPSQRVSDLAFLSPDEHRLITGSSHNVQRYDAATTLQLFESEADRKPDAVAVVSGRDSCTYKELNGRANQLARRLRSLGMGPGTLVGVGLERSVDMLAAVLGVMKCGAAYVPLDPAFPAERLAYMVEDSGTRLVLTQRSLKDEWPSGVATICLDFEEGALASEDSSNVESLSSLDHLAYVIYTSGSTGRPKGVQVSHRGLVNFLRSMRELPGFTERDVLLAVTTLSFDIAGLELYLPLVAGGTVVIATQEEVIDGHALLRLIHERHITVFQATPATYRLMLDAGWSGTPWLKVLCGGEAMSPELALSLLERSQEVWNMYGPTETTIWSTLERIESADGITVGRPIWNTSRYVLDVNLQPTPIGVPGELYIGGEGVARGYLGRPSLTAERFVPDPFTRTAGARMYRTGDIARLDEDGRIECLGRADFQVKVRGFRIELGEIEGALAALREVKEAVVHVHEDRSSDKRLVAYVVFQPGRELTSSEIRRGLRQTLPEYMIPSFVVPLDRLPLTDNGKINRRALPDPMAIGARETHVPPRTAMERTIAAIWADALKVDSLAVFDNFFEIGGHSLLAMQVIAGIERQTRVRLSLRVLIMDTLQQIAARCDREALSHSV